MHAKNNNNIVVVVKRLSGGVVVVLVGGGAHACVRVFAAADWLGHPHPSGLLHEEAPLVCAEEQENRLQASQIERSQHTHTHTPQPGSAGGPPRRDPGGGRTAVKVQTNFYN